MANSVNKVFLIGNLTRDPELRYTTSGTAVTELGLALNRKYGDKEETTFVDVTVWGSQAESCCKYLNKGRQVHIFGRLHLDSWEKDGQKRSKLVVIAENNDGVTFLGGKRLDENESEASQDAETSAEAPQEQDVF